MTAPSILCVHQGYELYGSDRTFIQSVRSLREQFPKSRITVLLPKAGPLVQHLAAHASEVIIASMCVLRKRDLKERGPTFLLQLLQRTRLAALQIKAHDLVYINSIVVLDYLLATRLSGKPVILHIHEIPTGIARGLFSLLAHLSRAMLIFNSNATRQAFQLPTRRPTLVIHNGVALPMGCPFPLPDSPKLHLLLIGRINAWKGQNLLLHALALLTPEERTMLEVRLVGGVFEDQAHFKANILDLRCTLGLEDFVTLEGFTASPQCHYEWAHIVVVPSIQPEPFGLVAAEAMAYGRAVIAAGHGGLMEIVADGETGRHFTPGEAAALARAISAYLCDRAMVTRHGAAGHQRFLAKFQETHYLRNIGAVAANLLERGKG